MGGYICSKCKEEVDLNPVKEKIICPQCSGRMLIKKRPEQRKTVKAE